MESGDGNENPTNSVSHSGYTKSDETKFKDAVFKHVSAGSKTIEPQSLVGILSDSVGTPLNGFNSRLSSVEVKLDLILTKLNNYCDSTNEANKKCNDRITKCEDSMVKIANIIPKVATALTNSFDSFQYAISEALSEVDRKMESLQKVHLHHILKVNIREQRARSWSVRIHSWVNYSTNVQEDKQDTAPEIIVTQVEEDTSTTIQPDKNRKADSVETQIFNKLIRPTLQLAVDREELKYIPSRMEDIIDVGHKIAGPKGFPPSYIFCFLKRPLLYAFMRNRHDILKTINEDNQKANPTLRDRITNGAARICRAGADLTPLNRAVLTFLHNEKQVMWSKVSGDKIIFKTHEEPDRWQLCINPFARSLQEMTLPPVDLNAFLRNSYNPLPPFLMASHNQDGSVNKARQFGQGGGGVDSGLAGQGSQNVPGGGEVYVGSQGGSGVHAKDSVKSSTNKCRSQLSRTVSSIKKQFNREISSFSKEMGILQEARSSIVESAELIVGDLAQAINDIDQQAAGGDASEESLTSDSESENSADAVESATTASAVPPATRAVRDRSASEKRKISPLKENTPKKHRSSQRNLKKK